MTFVGNSLNFANLTSKATPVGADKVMIADSAAGNAIKQATVSSILSGASAGALTFIASVTASASATVDFSNNLSATYDNYLVVVEDMLPASASTTLFARVGTGAGPTYQATAYSGVTACFSGATTTAITGTTAFGLTKISSMLANANLVAGGHFLFTNVNSATYKNVNGQITYADSITSTTGVICINGGQWAGATVLTSLRFLMSSGNIASGIFKLYGYQNS